MSVENSYFSLSRARALALPFLLRASLTCRSRTAEASTMLRTMKRFTALSLGTRTPDDSQRTRLTCWVGWLVGEGEERGEGKKKKE